METLGCKVNQYESAYLLDLLSSAGFQIVPFRDNADLYLVHSCAVTAKAAYQTRQLLRRAHRQNPQAHIVVAGCDAQLEPDRLEGERLATHILGTMEKYRLLEFLQRPASREEPLRVTGNPRLRTALEALPVRTLLTGRARAFLKIQDGCDAFCTYCVIPHTRGKSRSLPPQDIQTQLNRFLESGFQEVVLTGIHLGQWGADFQPRQDLCGLLPLMDGSLGSARIRMSSLEPMELTASLLTALRSRAWICPHFHIPLQNGDPEILARMGRPYSPDQYAEILFELHRLFPEASIGADVMVGFPGETDKHFRNTHSLIERLPLTYLHVFPFSPRPGTPARAWPDRPSGAEVKHRVRVLWEMGLRKRKAFAGRFVGQRLQVLAESPHSSGWWQGTSENYLKVHFSSPTLLSPGALVNVHCEGMEDNGLRGRVIGPLSGKTPK